MTTADVRQQTRDQAEAIIEPFAGSASLARLAVDRLIAANLLAGLIREADNTGNDAKRPTLDEITAVWINAEAKYREQYGHDPDDLGETWACIEALQTKFRVLARSSGVADNTDVTFDRTPSSVRKLTMKVTSDVSEGVADTAGKFTPEYDAGWLDGYNRAKDEDKADRDALIEAAQDHRKAASLALNRVYELEAIERARESQKSVEGVADTVKEGNNDE